MQADFDDPFWESQFREWESLDELNAWLAERARAYNARPHRALFGLSPDQVKRLLEGDWVEHGPLRLNTTLTLRDLRHARFLNNATAFLTALERGPTPTTSAGNLNRKFVRYLIDHGQWDEYVLRLTLDYKTAINEHDVHDLHVLRLVLEIGGLIKRRSAKFSITRKGAHLLGEGRAGELYAHLFRTFFRTFNLAYLDRYPDNVALQQTIPITLYALGQEKRRWSTPENLADRILPDAVFDQPGDPLRNPAYVEFETRVLRPLNWFGLFEKREVDSTYVFLPDFEYRKSQLYDRALRFRFASSES